MSLPKFELDPAIGLSEIKLGTSLYTMLHQLSHLHLQVSYSPPPDVLIDPITLTIKKYGIRMTFDPSRQLLIKIELLDLGKLEVSYKGKPIRDKGLRTLYDHYIGPTYPGSFHDGAYVLSYPGVSFRFEMKREWLSQLESKKDDKELLEWLLEMNPRATSIAVHRYDKWLPGANKDGENLRARLDDIERLCSGDIEVDKLISYGDGKVLVKLFKHPSLKELKLVLKESMQQDILADLGPPDEVFTKNDSRTLIHSSSSKSLGSNSASVFHNYFRFGFDLLYTTERTGAVLSKVIIHNNLPTSVMFGKYAKCYWEYFKGKQGLAGSLIHVKPNEMRFSKSGIQELFEGKITAVVLNRNEMLSSSIELLEQDGVGEGDGNEIKWGKSTVYACDGVIWDVVDDCINSITLY
ncbi:CYFA0S34e00276g1_1 [Cyberlindnera fabianii]|uniref:CYFA0S34e00276g1_1 n=1 Tax=Cyberlindnera fabianii TaxID=36022 RepID=A0A061BE17_CYBFA|nr:CYFA0S34e00276g1_1 [Cyberlindnera fabianii]